MSYFTPDLSGSLENYLVTVDPYKLYETNQKIVFEHGPIFLDTLVISFINDAAALLVDGVDWEATDADFNTTEMSKAKLQDGSFSRILVNSITILRDLSGGAIDVNMRYQRLYPVAHKLATSSGSIDLTPELVLDILMRMQSLESLVGTGTASIVPSEITPVLLEFDPHGLNADNLIAAQEYVIDVFSHKNIIQPVQGPFFKDSVVLTIVDTEEELELGVDYLIQGVNQALTRNTLNPSGVYQFIIITREMAGAVALTYHAVGGAVSPEVMGDIVAQVNSITSYLGDRAFLTAPSLQSSLLYQGLLNRMTTMENRMRVLASSGMPDYGDSTNGVTVMKTLTALDTQLHWYNVARLYKVDGSNDIFLADRARFRVKLVAAKFMADVIAGLDLTLTRDQFSLSAQNVVQDVKYTLFGASEAASGVIMPQFRVIWNNDAGTIDAGAYLQIGVALPGLTDTLVIEDYSGIESAWILLPNSGSPETPKDDTVTLPDTVGIWDTGQAESLSATKMVPSAKPYRIWEGAADLSTFDIADDVTHLLPAHFRVEDVTEVQVVILDAGDASHFVVNVPMISGGAGQAAGRATLLADTGNELAVRIFRDVSDDIIVRMGGTLGVAWTTPDLADLSVKYILAKVG